MDTGARIVPFNFGTDWTKLYTSLIQNNTKDWTDNNNNIPDHVYGAVIMAEPLREFTRFI